MEGLTFHIENGDQIKSSLSDYEMINFSFYRTVVIQNINLDYFPNYDSIYPEDLKEFMWKNVIPEDEKKIYQNQTRKEPHLSRAECTLYKNYLDHTFLFEADDIYLQSKWVMKCANLKYLNDKMYIIKMNPFTKEFEIVQNP